MNCSLAARISSGNRFWSCEVSPAKMDADTAQLLTSIHNLQETCHPLFTAVSWHLAFKSCNVKELLEDLQPLKLAASLGHLDSVLLNLSSAGLTKKQVFSVLNQAKQMGVKNIFALRGDTVEINNNMVDGFSYAKDLVHFIRQHFGNDLTIGVAGYPAGHPDLTSVRQDLQHLKEKVDAGADFILTQFFFEAEVFIRFVQNCREMGIEVPIIPGILPIQDYPSLLHATKICRVDIPRHVMNTIQPIRDNPEAVRKYGISLAIKMVSQIFAVGAAPGVHFFTFNRMSAIYEICKCLGFYPTQPMGSSCQVQAKSSDVHPVVDRTQEEFTNNKLT